MLDVNQIHNIDCIQGMKMLPDNCIDMCVTSPPYWGLRDYGVEGQIGLEATLNEYLNKMVEVFAEVRRILKPEGTLWLNIGDAYATNGYQPHDKGAASSNPENCPAGWKATGRGQGAMKTSGISGLKPKDLIMIPARVAIALQESGWYVRSDIIWNKPNPMPESITDRPTKAHEYVFLMSKSERYYYDQDAIREPLSDSSIQRINQPTFNQQKGGNKDYGPKSNRSMRKALENFKNSDVTTKGRNKRTVWTIPIQAYSEAHFATFAEALIEPCILAGSPVNGIVLDPFMGSGTTALVSLRLNRQFIGFELNPEYIKIANRRVFSNCKRLTDYEQKKAKIMI